MTRQLVQVLAAAVMHQGGQLLWKVTPVGFLLQKLLPVSVEITGSLAQDIQAKPHPETKECRAS